MIKEQILFVGAGSMAEAIAKGILAKDVAGSSQITLSNRSNSERLQILHATYGVQICSVDSIEFAKAIEQAQVLVLAMKPKDAGAALKSLRASLQPGQLIVSVIAGLSIATMSSILGSDVAIVRTMPNTSSTIGLGATGIAFSATVTEEQKILTRELFGATGVTVEVAEPLLDAVTGLSGSGPAYIYYMMEAMTAAGVDLGLTVEQAHLLTVQTVLGAAEMVRQTGEQPADLRAKVTSPNGTTQAALELLGAQQFPAVVDAAIKRAAAASTVL